MNQIILLILWSVITIALTITVVGLFVLVMMADDGWFTLPHQIINRVINP